MSNDQSSQNKSWFEKLTQAFAHEPKCRQDLLEFLHEAHNNNLLDADALTIVESAIQIADLQVRDIMLSRSQMVSIKINQSIQEFLPTIIETAHSRYPVLSEDGSEVMGILLAKDLLPYLLKQLSNSQVTALDIKKLLRPATYVPESKRVNVLLREFRATHNHMAIVIDEYGGVAGLVTIEDVLEQIVGDIEDEHDSEEESYIRPQPNGDFVVKAQTPIHVFNQYFPEERYSEEFGKTIGELVMRNFGYLPKRNETIVIGPFRYRVLTADSRKIHLLRLTPSNLTH